MRIPFDRPRIPAHTSPVTHSSTALCAHPVDGMDDACVVAARRRAVGAPLASALAAGVLAVGQLPRATASIAQYMVTLPTPGAPSLGLLVNGTGTSAIQYCVNQLQSCANYVLERGNATDYVPVPVSTSLCQISMAGRPSSVADCITRQAADLMTTDGHGLQNFSLLTLSGACIAFVAWGVYNDCRPRLVDCLDNLCGVRRNRPHAAWEHDIL